MPARTVKKAVVLVVRERGERNTHGIVVKAGCSEMRSCPLVQSFFRDVFPFDGIHKASASV